MKIKRILISIGILAALYCGSYVWFRQTHIETWEQDKQGYVIFPANAGYLYYFFRPLTYVDSVLTGMKFHIGPHR